MTEQRRGRLLGDAEEKGKEEWGDCLSFLVVLARYLYKGQALTTKRDHMVSGKTRWAKGKGRREKQKERKQTTRSPRSVHRKREKDLKKDTGGRGGITWQVH